VNEDDVEEPHHGCASVLDFHDLIATHVTSGNQSKRIKDAERGCDANVALSEHGRGRCPGDWAERGDRSLESLRGLNKSKSNSGAVHHLQEY